MLSRLLSIGIAVGLFVVFALAITEWINLPVGSLQDWLVGGAMFGWLLLVVTVPWNIYFRAKQVVNDAENSQDRGINLDPKQLKFAQAWVGRSLAIALALHLVSAAVFYVIAAWGIGKIGYWGALGALLLTFLRPIVSAYEYLSQRLQQIGEQVRYPREDIIEVRYRLSQLEQLLGEVNQKLDQENPDSWVVKQLEFMEETRRQFALINNQLQQIKVDNRQEIDRVRVESRQAIAQMTADGQFLDHVREIIRFFKTA